MENSHKTINESIETSHEAIDERIESAVAKLLNETQEDFNLDHQIGYR